jgi:hypothetical protein
MELRDANHVEIDDHLDPKAIEAALEQKTRFATRSSPGSGRARR